MVKLGKQIGGQRWRVRPLGLQQRAPQRLLTIRRHKNRPQAQGLAGRRGSWSHC